MHIYGVGTSGNIGSRVELLLNKKYNEGRKKMNGKGFEKKTIPATVNAGVTGAKVTLDSNRATNIQRPFITVNSEVRDVWGDISDDLNHVSFLPENRPTLTYIYRLSDDEIKGLIDIGLYSNPRFEYLIDNLLSTEQYEITKDVDIRTLDVISDDAVTPVVLVEDLGIVEQPFNSDIEEDYTSFGYAVQQAIDMALQLEAEGISAGQSIGDEELILDEEVELEIDDVFEVNKDHDANAEIEEQILRELHALDEEVDVSDAIDVGQVFGQSSEEERIQQLRDASNKGIDWDDVETDDIFENENIPDDEFGFDDFAEDDDDFELVDEMEVDISYDEEPVVDVEDEDDDWDLDL